MITLTVHPIMVTLRVLGMGPNMVSGRIKVCTSVFSMSDHPDWVIN